MNDSFLKCTLLAIFLSSCSETEQADSRPYADIRLNLVDVRKISKSSIRVETRVKNGADGVVCIRTVDDTMVLGYAVYDGEGKLELENDIESPDIEHIRLGRAALNPGETVLILTEISELEFGYFEDDDGRLISYYETGDPFRVETMASLSSCGGQPTRFDVQYSELSRILRF